MARVRALAILAGFGLATVLLFAVVFAVLDRGTRRSDSVVIATKAFTESLILGELMAQRIEGATELRVERRYNLGGTKVCFEALRTGEVDLYPEYTGTGLMAILGLPVETDPEQVVLTVSDEFHRRYDMLWLPRLGAFNNTYALAMRRTQAEQLGVTKISDLTERPDLRAGFATEFLGRDDGYPGLRETYGLDFDEPPASMEAGLMYSAVAAGQVDVISAYATDGRIETLDLVVLEDDLAFFPPYQVCPLTRRDFAAARRDVVDALAPLSMLISDDEMRRLNASVESGDTPLREAARDYLADKGLGPSD